jgi:predicted dehydrogenase
MAALKVGIIGVGGIAKTHMPGWAASEHAEVIAGSDISEPFLQSWGQEFGVSKLSTKAEDLLKDPEIDIIDIHAQQLSRRQSPRWKQVNTSSASRWPPRPTPSAT